MANDPMFRRFIGVKAYNPNIPSVPCDATRSVTAQFTMSPLPFSAIHIDTTWLRIGIFVVTEKNKIYLHMDDQNNLFGNKTSEVCVGQVLLTDGIWNGMASIDVDTIRTEHPYMIHPF